MIRTTGMYSPMRVTGYNSVGEHALPPSEQVRRLAIQHDVLQEGSTSSSLVAVLEAIKCRCNPDSTAVRAFIEQLAALRERMPIDEEASALLAAFVRDMDPVLRLTTGERLKQCHISRAHEGDERARRLAAMLNDPLLAFSGALGRAEKEQVKEAGSLRLENESDLVPFSNFIERNRVDRQWIVRRLYAKIADKTGTLEKGCFDAMLSYVGEGDAEMMESVFECTGRLDKAVLITTWIALIRHVTAWPEQYHEKVIDLLFASLSPKWLCSDLDDAYQAARTLCADAEKFAERGDAVVAALLKLSAIQVLYCSCAALHNKTLYRHGLFDHLLSLPEEIGQLPEEVQERLEVYEHLQKALAGIIDSYNDPDFHPFYLP